MATAGYACINSAKTEIYETVTEPSDSCKKITLTENAYYVFVCEDVSKCVLKTTPTDFIGFLLVYQYKDGSFHQMKNNKYYLQGTKMISCLKGTKFASSGTFGDNGKCTVAANGIYINPNTDSSQSRSAKPIVKVTGGTGAADTSLTITAGNYYLDQSSFDSVSYKKLIYCSTATSCQSIAPSDGVYINAADSKQITCSSGSCTSGAPAATAIYLNSDVSGTLTNALISCTESSTCAVKDGVDKKYYMNGLTGSGFLIKCTTSDGCKKVNASTTGVYLDEGTKAAGTGNIENVIKCTSSEGGCSLVGKGTVNNVYLDADNTSNLIIDDGAKFTSAAKTTGFYLDQVNTKNVIQCTSDGCSTSPGSILKNHAYVDGTDATGKKLITYNSSGGTSANTLIVSVTDPSNKIYFIDGSNPKKVIECTGAGGGAACTAPQSPTFTTGKVLAFYNSHDSHTITCSSAGCISSIGNFT